jgi:hypothetical protein
MTDAKSMLRRATKFLVIRGLLGIAILLILGTFASILTLYVELTSIYDNFGTAIAIMMAITFAIIFYFFTRFPVFLTGSFKSGIEIAFILGTLTAVSTLVEVRADALKEATARAENNMNYAQLYARNLFKAPNLGDTCTDRKNPICELFFQAFTLSKGDIKTDEDIGKWLDLRQKIKSRFNLASMDGELDLSTGSNLNEQEKMLVRIVNQITSEYEVYNHLRSRQPIQRNLLSFLSDREIKIWALCFFFIGFCVAISRSALAPDESAKNLQISAKREIT